MMPTSQPTMMHTAALTGPQDSARNLQGIAPNVDNSNQVDTGSNELREAFNSFVGESFFTQLIQSMRKTVNKPAYMHGGHAEEVFQSQMDQILAEKMAETSSERLTQPMFELFTLRRS